MKLNQYAIYQLPAKAENRELRFRTWEDVQKQHLAVRVENYEQVFLAHALPDDTAETIWKRFLEKPPKKFKGHSLSVSDVIVHNKDGETMAYYVDKKQLYVVAGFFRLNSSGTLITMDTRDFQLEDKQGNWIATDEIIVDGRQFFLMQSEQFGAKAAFLVVSAEGKLVTDDCYNGFDETALLQIKNFQHPPVSKPMISHKPELEVWQKAYENGEYLRSAEMTEEANYNFIDGRINNTYGKKKDIDPKHRPSVLAVLHRKQKEIAARSGKQPQQIQEAERNRK